MNGAVGQRANQAAITECDRFNRGIVGDHGNHHVTALGNSGDRIDDCSAGVAKVLRLCRRSVVDRQVVAGIEQPAGHALAHAAQSDETYLHVTLLL